MDGARAEYQQQNWAGAARSFEKAANTFAALDDFDTEATARHNEGQALKRAGQPDAAAAAFERALAIHKRLVQKPEQAQDLAGLAQCDRALLKMDLAIQTDEEALKLATDSRPVTATLQNDLALTLLQRGHKEDQDRIIHLLTSALETDQSLGSKNSLAANHLNLGRAYLHFDQYDRAESNLQKALELFRALDDPVGLAHTHELLARLYLARNDKARAQFHLDQAREKFLFLKDEAGLHRLEQLKP